MAGVHAKTITSILYRDFLLLMAPHRALLAAAKFLCYLQTLSLDNRPARWALETSKQLPKGWYATLRRDLLLLDIDVLTWDYRLNLALQVEKALWIKQHVELELCLTWSRMLVWRHHPFPLHLAIPPKPALYLSLPRYLARQCARLRTSAHHLAIEHYRVGNRRRACHLRICQYCDANEVEDEYHALVTCRDTQAIRDQFNVPPRLIMKRSLTIPDRAAAEFVAAIFRHVDKRFEP
ncbi:hypothetical protein BJ508DRAFT_322176 [Ascobolus immersus RN42]|uniref:Uncharacterized protein n=1 Tax=Ascobolus immersus RN42 TaxID=1160509 RepID=A0A3N4IP76_ASCIM|nr:hypothetical protein BJ508DRAFT_322176 [Ascobolus immersus RN42]